MATGLIFALVTLLLVQDHSNGYCFNHQTDTYNEQFNLKTCSSCSVTPFLSPDNSLEAHLQMIEEAQESISIANPTFVSWLRECRLYNGDCKRDKCTGCELSYYRNNETFPLFAALLNAINLRKIAVKILTNNYSVPTCQDKATLLDWLSINKAGIKMYKTTSFLHAKFMMIDGGKKVLISSVNFSQRSFMENRESGVIMSECTDDCDVIELYKSVYDHDWNNGDHYTMSNVYTDEQIKIMTDPSRYPNTVVTPPSQRVPNTSVMNLTTFSGVKIFGYVSPDHARETFFTTINKTRNSLKVHIYEVTDMSICHQLVNLKNNGINVTMLVSVRVSQPRETIHKKCYQKLTSNGITVVYSSKRFCFSHQKYWIIDDKTVHLSTGNWALSDFAKGDSWEPHLGSDENVNRNMLVIMESPQITEFFNKVFHHDLAIGTLT